MNVRHVRHLGGHRGPRATLAAAAQTGRLHPRARSVLQVKQTGGVLPPAPVSIARRGGAKPDAVLASRFAIVAGASLCPTAGRSACKARQPLFAGRLRLGAIRDRCRADVLPTGPAYPAGPAIQRSMWAMTLNDSDELLTDLKAGPDRRRGAGPAHPSGRPRRGSPGHDPGRGRPFVMLGAHECGRTRKGPPNCSSVSIGFQVRHRTDRRADCRAPSASAGTTRGARQDELQIDRCDRSAMVAAGLGGDRGCPAHGKPLDERPYCGPRAEPRPQRADPARLRPGLCPWRGPHEIAASLR